MAGPTQRSNEAAQRQALREAAEWFAERQAGELSAAQRDRWQAWLDVSETHRWAWQRVEAIGRRFGVELGESERRAAAGAIGQARQRRRGRRHLLAGLASLAVAAVLAGALWQASPVPQWVARWGADYHTATGEIARVVLNDGTQVWLNSASAFNVDYDGAARRLELVTGEVLVDTGEDPERPLYLDTEQARLTPLGTRFSVRQRVDDELLAVFEGAVEIHTRAHEAPSGSRLAIDAGHQASYSTAGIERPEPVERAREAWANGILLAENMTLEVFAAELGRHHRGWIQVDPAVAELTLLGAYPLHDLERTLHMVETTLPVRVRRELPGWITLEPAASSRE